MSWCHIRLWLDQIDPGLIYKFKSLGYSAQRCQILSFELPAAETEKSLAPLLR